MAASCNSDPGTKKAVNLIWALESVVILSVTGGGSASDPLIDPDAGCR